MAAHGDDAWGLDLAAQWFANRGYVCVQVNFRGSTGYGKDFVNAGDKEWGRAMHTDLLDSIDYVVERGWVDRERIAIYGGSYGGYAALAGSVHPGCVSGAPSTCGPSNLLTLIASVPEYWQPLIAQFHTRIGDPETEKDMLWDRSPLSRVDDIRIPVLVGQGANDPRVKQAEAEQIVEALKDKGVSTSTCCSPTRATAWSSRRTASASRPPLSASSPSTLAAAARTSRDP